MSHRIVGPPTPTLRLPRLNDIMCALAGLEMVIFGHVLSQCYRWPPGGYSLILSLLSDVTETGFSRNLSSSERKPEV